MNQPFFITGFPRSMTAWLSVALDCAHERDGKSMADFMRELESGKQIGDSSSIVPMFYDDIKKRYPDSKWVVIDRSKDECLDSFCKVSKLPLKECAFLFDHLEQCISKISPSLTVKFSDISLRIRDIWDWCRPEIEFPRERIHRLQMLNIQQKASLIQMGAGTL